MVEITVYTDIEHNTPIYLTSDVSHDKLSAVLTQLQNGNQTIIVHATRQLTLTEQNLPINKRESLAILWALTVFEEFTAGEQIIIATDYTPLSMQIANTTEGL
jgi:hypothetical protein